VALLQLLLKLVPQFSVSTAKQRLLGVLGPPRLEVLGITARAGTLSILGRAHDFRLRRRRDLHVGRARFGCEFLFFSVRCECGRVILPLYIFDI
jgi:hypothetical protein